METLTLSRVIFLIFIVILSVYFVYLNKSFEVREHYENVPSDKVDEIVIDTYKEVFKREPTEQEKAFFQAVNIEKQPSKEELISMIKSSGDMLQQYYERSTSETVFGESAILNKAYGTEDEVSEIFNTILDRLPSEQELIHFARLLKEDSNFNMEKLKQILYGSEEYQRLARTQSNQVYATTMGGVTDRQITLMVTENYKAVTGKDSIDEDEMRLFKKKLVEFNLDESIFRKFLENYFKNIPFNQQLAASVKAKTFTAAPQNTSTNQDQQVYDKMKKELYTQVMEDIKKQNLAQQQTKSYTTQSGSTVPQIEQPNKQVIEVLLRTSAGTDGNTREADNYLDSSNVLDTIKREAQCVFDKNATDRYYQNMQEKEKSMADLIEKRNRESLKDTCVRNKTYLGLDEDMVLDPALKWSVPQKRPPLCVGTTDKYQPRVEQTALIGTLLEDAKDTKVGSMVSFLPPK